MQGSHAYHHIDLRYGLHACVCRGLLTTPHFLIRSVSADARNPASVHGLLGQTHRPSTPVPGTLKVASWLFARAIGVTLFVCSCEVCVSIGVQGEGVLEGALEDSVVRDGEFGTQFRFNRVSIIALR
jgi:hypothetical protein